MKFEDPRWKRFYFMSNVKVLGQNDKQTNRQTDRQTDPIQFYGTQLWWGGSGFTIWHREIFHNTLLDTNKLSIKLLQLNVFKALGC